MSLKGIYNQTTFDFVNVKLRIIFIENNSKLKCFFFYCKDYLKAENYNLKFKKKVIFFTSDTKNNNNLIIIV